MSIITLSPFDHKRWSSSPLALKEEYNHPFSPLALKEEYNHPFSLP